MTKNTQTDKTHEDDAMKIMQATASWKARYRFLTYEEADAEIAAAKATKDKGND